MKIFSRALVVAASVLMCLVASPRGLSAQITVQQTFCTGTNPCVTTYHNDNNRDGVNPNEIVFTPTTSFSSLLPMIQATDGLIYAQPLYIKNLDNSSHKIGDCPSPANLVFVATENNSVYAIEPTNPLIGNPVNLNPCWMLNLNQAGETAIPYTSLPANSSGVHCQNISPQVGITGTPAIDVSVTPPILYVVTSHLNTSTLALSERLHAIDTTTGIEEPWSPVDIASKLGNTFNIIAENQRAGLALTHPTATPNLANIYVAWASNCDYEPTNGFYDGWIAGFQVNYNTPGFSLLGSFISEPTTAAHQGGIWMAGSAPAIDANGNVYIAVANGDVSPPSQTSHEWGDSVLKLPSNLGPQPTVPGVLPLDFYTPNDWFQLDGGGTVCFVPSTTTCPMGDALALAPKGDTDMGTGGVVLLSNSSPSELVSVGKQGIVYLVPYDTSTNSFTTMGGLDGCGYLGCSTQSLPQNTACSVSTTLPTPGYIAQCFDAMPIADFNPSTDLNGIRGAPSFWSAGATSPNQYLFAIGLHDRMYWFNYAAPKFSTSSPPQSDHEFTEDNGFIGGTASVTWNSLGSASTGVVWALDSNLSGILTDKGTYRAAGPAGLYIYPAIPPSPLCDNNTSICEIWDSTTDLPNYKTVMPGAVKFTVPTVVDGYVLIGGGSPGYFGTTACPAPTTPPFSCAGQLTILAIPPK